MTDAAIRVENIRKRYVCDTGQLKRERMKTTQQ